MAKRARMTGIGRTGGHLAWHNKLTPIGQGVALRLTGQLQPNAASKLRHREVSEILQPDSAIAVWNQMAVTQAGP